MYRLISDLNSTSLVFSTQGLLLDISWNFAMSRRGKELICQFSVIVFLLYVLSLEDELQEQTDQNLTLSAVLGVKQKKIKVIRDKDGHYMLSNLTKSWFKGNQTFPITLNTGFLIQPNKTCPYNRTVDYLIMVNSATDNFERRLTIRNTFGQNNLFSHMIHRTVFLLGKTPSVESTQQIKAEALQYNDIIQGDFHDSYHNLTLKGIMGLRWINQSCPNLKVIVKIDDDVYVNVFRLLVNWMPKFVTKAPALGCELLSKGKSIIYRDKRKKWTVDDNYFHGFDSFPFQHCKGYYVVMTGDLVAPFLEAAKITPFFWIDDVYLYGLLPLTVGVERMWKFWRDHTESYSYMMHCILTGARKCKFGIFNGDNEFSSERFHNLWSKQLEMLTSKEKEEFHWIGGTN